MKYQQTQNKEVLAQPAKNDRRIGAFDDVPTGSDYIKTVQDGDIAPTDMVLIFFTDGAKLYRKKHPTPGYDIHLLWH